METKGKIRKMIYKEFDKHKIIGKERHKQIASVLMSKPMTIKQITKETGLLYHQVSSSLNFLVRLEIVTKRRDYEFTYFGIKLNIRKKHSKESLLELLS